MAILGHEHEHAHPFIGLRPLRASDGGVPQRRLAARTDVDPRMPRHSLGEVFGGSGAYSFTGPFPTSGGRTVGLDSAKTVKQRGGTQ